MSSQKNLKVPNTSLHCELALVKTEEQQECRFFCHFADSSVTYRERIPPACLISGLFSKNKRGQRVFCLKIPRQGTSGQLYSCKCKLKSFCCGDIPEAPGDWSTSETSKSPTLHRCHCLALVHAPTILPLLVHVAHYTYAVGSDRSCQTCGEVL